MPCKNSGKVNAKDFLHQFICTKRTDLSKGSHTGRVRQASANSNISNQNIYAIILLLLLVESKYISYKMGRSQTAIRMRLEKLIGSK